MPIQRRPSALIDDGAPTASANQCLRVPAIEHFEHREDGEHDRLAESGEEPGDAEHDFNRDDQRHETEARRRAHSRRRIRKRTPRRAVSNVVMIWRSDG